MNFLSLENISKSYSEKVLINYISIGISDNDKIGVIGINGTGKSTLLKIIAGIENIDSGKIIKGNLITIGYLSQNPEFDSEASVIEQIFNGNSPIMKLVKDYEEAIQENGASNEKIIRLSHEMDERNAWNIENDAKTILMRLGISNFNDKVGTLSGGQKKRIALAAVLISPSDLLILDEPTNHLDNETIDWLEQYLNKRKGSLLMVTHDRYFLDRVVNEIIELDGGNLYTYRGNYSDFLEKKIERENIENTNEKKRQGLYKKELAWIRKGAKARTTKQKARIDRFELIGEKKINLSEEKIEISAVSTRLGKKIIEIEHLYKSFKEIKLIDDFSYILLRNDRIGIIGPNASGKSTLMNMINGKLNPDSGDIQIGETVKISLYSQETDDMDNNLRVIEYIKEGGEILTTADGSKITAAQMLERFLFPPEMQWSIIGKLSGGEKKRLYLLRVLMESPNILLLDEPTNDLDIQTLTILEEYLESFKGAVISVSHDRYFLDRTCEKIFAFEENSKINKYNGNYSDYKEKIENEITSNKKAEDLSDNIPSIKKEKPLKFTFKEQKEYEEIDSTVALIENKIALLQIKINATATDYALLEQLLSEKGGLEKQLEVKMGRWIYLNELAEKIEQIK